MATTVAMKRMARERKMLAKPNDDYFVNFKDDNLFKFEAYVIGTSDTLYSHKVVKLQFEIPIDYPLKPPKVTFVQHSGGRIHPNLYVEGKVCLSILGTWDGEPWAFAMTTETVLITIRSLLDNKPYTHEPNCRDNPAYNDYVQYGTWRWLLLDYLRNEQDSAMRLFLETHVAKHGDEMIAELRRQAVKNANVKHFSSPYVMKNTPLIPNYKVLEKELVTAVEGCKAKVAA